MPAQYAVGQTLPNGAICVSDTYTVDGAGDSLEVVVDNLHNTVSLYTPGPGTSDANAATVRANILTRQNQILAWIAANPTGAVLTAAQTLTLAEMLNGLCKLLLQQYGNTTGT